MRPRRSTTTAPTAFRRQVARRAAARAMAMKYSSRLNRGCSGMMHLLKMTNAVGAPGRGRPPIAEDPRRRHHDLDQPPGRMGERPTPGEHVHELKRPPYVESSQQAKHQV